MGGRISFIDGDMCKGVRAMDLGLKGKVAIVAASSKGLGRAVAATLAREGALVTINGREAETLKATGDAIRAESGADLLEIVGDMRNPDDIQRLVQETVAKRGGLDIMICNAGGPPAKNFPAGRGVTDCGETAAIARAVIHRHRPKRFRLRISY